MKPFLFSHSHTYGILSVLLCVGVKTSFMHTLKVCWDSTCTCVPGIPAAGPWNLSTKGWKQVEESPRLDDNIRHGGVCNHNLGSVTNTWGDRQHLVNLGYLKWWNNTAEWLLTLQCKDPYLVCICFVYACVLPVCSAPPVLCWFLCPIKFVTLCPTRFAAVTYYCSLGNEGSLSNRVILPISGLQAVCMCIPKLK